MRLWISFFLGISLFIFSALVHADEFTVEQLRLYESDNIYYVDASLSLKLKDAALEALENGVPLYIETNIEVLKENSWFPDSSVSSLNQTYKIQYFELAKLYQLTNLNTKKQSNFLFLGAVLLEMGNLVRFPLIDKVLLAKDEKYYLEVKIDLLMSKLPLPLIPIALVSGDWEHESSTYHLPID